MPVPDYEAMARAGAEEFLDQLDAEVGDWWRQITKFDTIDGPLANRLYTLSLAVKEARKASK
jgi:hypothetical protein